MLFISSCFVHVRKPDADIFRLALDISQAPAEQVVYIENTPMFVQIAESLGIRSILHTRITGPRARQLASLRTAKLTLESSMNPARPRILTINGGSSSIKFALFEAGELAAIEFWQGTIERIGLPRPPCG